MPQSNLNTRWLPSLGLVMALHAAVWWGMSHLKHDATRPLPLPVMNADLLPPPPPPKVEPVRPPPPPPPRKAPPPKPLQPSPPPPLPVLSSQAADAPAMPAPPLEAPKPPPPAAAPPPQPAPPVAAPRPAPEPALEPPRFQAAYLSNPPPAYPIAARRRGIEGTVLVHAEVSAEGACLRAELKKSSGAEMLDQAALEAVRKWRFVPAKRGPVAVVAWVEVPVTFKLEN